MACECDTIGLKLECLRMATETDVVDDKMETVRTATRNEVLEAAKAYFQWVTEPTEGSAPPPLKLVPKEGA